MSAQTAPHPSQVDQGGSAENAPLDGDVPSSETALGSEQPSDENSAEGVLPEPGEQTSEQGVGGGSGDEPPEKAALEARVQQLESMLVQALSDRGSSPSGGGAPELDPYAEFANREFHVEGDENGAWARKMAAHGQFIEQQVLARVAALLDQKLAPINGTVAETAFERSLSASGVTSDEMRTPEFRALRRTFEQDQEFKLIQRSRPQYAAKLIGSQWKATQAARRSNAAQHGRIEAAKGSKLAGAAPRGSASPGKLSVGRNDPKALAKVRDYLSSGGNLKDVTYTLD